MPPPYLGRKPYGKPDKRLIDDSPFAWKITEMEEEYMLKPGIEHIGHQMRDAVVAGCLLAQASAWVSRQQPCKPLRSRRRRADRAGAAAG